MNLEDHPTPLTDAATVTTDWLSGESIVPSTFARDLELKLALVTKERDALQGALEHPEDERHSCRFKKERDAAIRVAEAALATNDEQLTKERDELLRKLALARVGLWKIKNKATPCESYRDNRWCGCVEHNSTDINEQCLRCIAHETLEATKPTP